MNWKYVICRLNMQSSSYACQMRRATLLAQQLQRRFHLKWDENMVFISQFGLSGLPKTWIKLVKFFFFWVVSRYWLNLRFWVNYSFNFWPSQKLNLEIHKCVFPATLTRWLWMIHGSPLKGSFQWKLWTACFCPVCWCKVRPAEGGMSLKGYWISCSFNERTVINMKSMNEPELK